MAAALTPRVHEYSQTKLTRLLVFASHLPAGEETLPEDKRENWFVTEKSHVAYLHGYLTKKSCARIVEEPEYIDRDFLEDFSAYHARSFGNYGRRCTRLHFFKQTFDASILDQTIVKGPKAIDLQQGYIGFIVVRPLPVTLIGRTCLEPYPAKRGVERRYPTTYRQHADLCGIPLHVETVAFQEQDRDVAACATSALWSVLQCTGRKFQHTIPSPIAITGTAAATGGYDERMLPAVAGLTIRQIADTLRFVGLEPHVIPLEVHAEEGNAETRGPDAPSPPAHQGEALLSGAGEAETPVATTAQQPSALAAAAERMGLELKIAVAAYLDAGIPCLLLLRITDIGGEQPDRQVNHAVAVTGYRIGAGGTCGLGESGVHFDASRMDKLFVHDDQVGPFAKMHFTTGGQLSTSWPDGLRMKETLARSHTLVVPLNHKIRTPFKSVLLLALALGRRFDAVRERFNQFEALAGSRSYSWDIKLSSLKQFRKEIRAGALPDDEKLRLLSQQMPKHMWRIFALVDGVRALELVLDATDLVQGEQVIELIIHSTVEAQIYGMVFKGADRRFDETPAHRRARRMLAAIEQPKDAAKAFGRPAA